MAETILQPNQPPLELRDLGFVITATNMVAHVTTFPGSASGTRSGGPGLNPKILEAADVFEMGTVMLQDQNPQRDLDKSVSLYVPAGSSEEGRLLLYFDEMGGVTFHLPQEEQRPPAGVRAVGRMVRFDVTIRKPVQQSGAPAPVRGIGGIVAQKLLKVFGWKVAGAAARRFGPPLIRRWETKYRPTRVLGKEDLFVADAAPLATPIPPAERSLLFIHGTFSRIASAFNGIHSDREFLAKLDARYGEQIYGFDHATLATGVATNVMQLYEQLGPGIHNFDIICHSRGGLVARALRDLTEHQLKQCFLLDARRGQYEGELKEWGMKWQIPDGVHVKVERILFAGTPNNGTVLAQPTHLKKYLDILMTATNILPDVADIAVDGLLMTAKLLISDVLPVLPGLDDQKPESNLLKLLKPAPIAKDAAIQANYTPPPGLQAIMRATDAVADFVFGDEENDLVVPTIGVSQWPNGVFGDDRRLPFSADIGAHHCNLFLQDRTRQHLLTWLHS